MYCYNDHSWLLVLCSEVGKSNTSVYNQFFKNFVNLVAKLTSINNNHNLYLIRWQFLINSHKSCYGKCSSFTRTSWGLNYQILEGSTSGQGNSSGLNLGWLQKAHLLQIFPELLRHIKMFIVPVLSL